MLKTIGIVFVLLGASGTGLGMAWSVRRSLGLTRQFYAALAQMKNEIAYLKTPLPELMRLLAAQFPGPLSVLFADMEKQLRLRQAASVYAIVRKSLRAAPPLPAELSRIFLDLAPGLGQYDVEGQLRAIDLAAAQTGALLEQYQAEQKGRVRSYCTLGICAGLAIAIMVL